MIDPDPQFGRKSRTTSPRRYCQRRIVRKVVAGKVDKGGQADRV
jgi:hypothetical protein